MDQKKIGSFLKELRKEKGITQEQFAENLNVSGRTVSRWETGTNMPDISLLVDIAEFFDVSIPEIINGERKSEIMEKEVKEQTLALEMLSELKKTTKRWFVVSIILLIALVGTNVAWLIYESSFDTVYEDSTQETHYTDNSTITQHIE